MFFCRAALMISLTDDPLLPVAINIFSKPAFCCWRRTLIGFIP